MIVAGQSIAMEVDTGTALSLVSKSRYREGPLARNDTGIKFQVLLLLKSWENPFMVGSVDLSVQYKDQITDFPLLVAEGSALTLSGRNWLQCIKFD